MEETQRHRPPPSRLGLRHAVGGEIVEVQGGHIVRSTGRKDRHSKVCTAKGPRDRRVRLSAHTAIQFYDVQDRLGYDRPSKAVDWLIKKAKAAIDELEELPPWNPTAGSAVDAEQQNNQEEREREGVNSKLGRGVGVQDFEGSSSKYEANQSQSHIDCENHHHSSSFLPASMDSDLIADTIKSFFPIGAAAEPISTGLQFHQSFPPPSLLSRTSSHSQDLRLSLQSFENPIFLQNRNQHHSTAVGQQTDPVLLGFDAASSGWSDHQFQRLVAWNSAGDAAAAVGGGGFAGGGFAYNSPAPPQTLLQPVFGNQFVSQRGPLQSSNTQSIRAWIDPPPSVAVAAPAGNPHQSFPIHHHHPSAFQGVNFSSFSGFRIPARIQGEEEEHDGVSNKPSSASSDSISRH